MKKLRQRSPTAFRLDRNARSLALRPFVPAWQPMCTDTSQEMTMRVKIHDGTACSSESSLCNTCRNATITRGRRLDEEIVQCHAVPMQRTRITFKVTFCSSYSDARLPSYIEMMEDAWILQPASKRRPAGFVRSRDLKDDDLAMLRVELRDRIED